MAATTTRRTSSRTAAAEKARAKLATVPDPDAKSLGEALSDGGTIKAGTPAAAPVSEETPKPALSAVPNPSETPKQAPTPALKAKPDVTVEAVPVTYYRPSVKFPDGRVVVCQHRYLHENEKAGAACGRKIAALGKFAK